MFICENLLNSPFDTVLLSLRESSIYKTKWEYNKYARNQNRTAKQNIEIRRNDAEIHQVRLGDVVL